MDQRAHCCLGRAVGHLQAALGSARRSVSEEDAAWYAALAEAVAVGGQFPERPATEEENGNTVEPTDNRSPEELRSELEANIAAIKIASREQRAWETIAQRFVQQQ